MSAFGGSANPTPPQAKPSQESKARDRIGPTLTKRRIIVSRAGEDAPERITLAELFKIIPASCQRKEIKANKTKDFDCRSSASYDIQLR
jgi:hypothetical protein